MSLLRLCHNSLRAHELLSNYLGVNQELKQLNTVCFSEWQSKYVKVKHKANLKLRKTSLILHSLFSSALLSVRVEPV